MTPLTRVHPDRVRALRPGEVGPGPVIHWMRRDQRVRDNWRVTTVAELLLYTMRHVQEHAAHLNMLLGQQTDSAPGWVGQVKKDCPVKNGAGKRG